MKPLNLVSVPDTPRRIIELTISETFGLPERRAQAIARLAIETLINEIALKNHVLADCIRSAADG